MILFKRGFRHVLQEICTTHGFFAKIIYRVYRASNMMLLFINNGASYSAPLLPLHLCFVYVIVIFFNTLSNYSKWIILNIALKILPLKLAVFGPRSFGVFWKKMEVILYFRMICHTHSITVLCLIYPIIKSQICAIII